MPHTTVVMSDEMQEDMRECKKQLGIDMSTVLSQLYKGWREGAISLSTLPDGTKVNGPLAKR